MSDMPESEQKNEQEVSSEAGAEQQASGESRQPGAAPENAKAEDAGSQPESAAEPAKPTPEQLLAELQDKYLRLRADFDNYRKRMAREASETRERAKISVIGEFLPVYDYFQMAMEQPGQDINILRAGMQMIQNEFTKTLNNLGVVELQAVGQAFDPQWHDAVKTEASDTVADGVVISQWKKGYKIGGTLVRPAMVVVSSGPAKPEVSSEETAPGEPAQGTEG
ncbi:MAG: nucleotide exchange factor GrpE [Victivallales bacterium]|nr:nucleotide exchange factor GrpE [Victivallales bacterium]